MAMAARLAVQSVRNMSSHVGDRAALLAGQKRWYRISAFIGVPLVALSFLHVVYETFVLGHGHERTEFIAYDHLRIRTKKFPWGDGQKTLFHHPHMNALPDGYEDDH